MGNQTCAGCFDSPPPNEEVGTRRNSQGNYADLAARLYTAGAEEGVGADTADKVVSAEEQKLFLRVIDKLEEHDEFLSANSDTNSEVGDSMIDDMILDYGDDLELQRADELEDPKIEDWELVNAWHQLRHHKLPDKLLSERILKSMTKRHAATPNVVQVPRPGAGQQLIVVGDLHGHLGDLMHILDTYGEPLEGVGGTTYIFNGDFVDRGIWGPEVLLCLYCLKLRFPNAVHLNRGNHEDLKMNTQQANGFRDVHCVRAWKGDAYYMYKLCRRSFLCLPLVAVIGGEICVLHGGLPLDTNVTLEEINKIDRKRDVPMSSCTALGYPNKQQVTAKKMMYTRHGARIQPGAPGEIIQKVKKSRSVEVAFDEGLATVSVFGAPELEQDLNIVYQSSEQRELQRLDRILISLLWSDPIEHGHPEVPGPNTSRGMGTRFDDTVTANFLKANGLSCILRSHQKRGNGYETEHRAGGKPTAVTIFSASNYPGGAGELIGDGNLASVAVFAGDEKSESLPLVSVMKPSKAWAEPHSDLVHWSRPQLEARVGNGERGKSLAVLKNLAIQEHDESRKGKARAQALGHLWMMIYCYRPELMAFFSDFDKAQTGKVDAKQWVSAMRGCLLPDESFPWEELAPHLARFDKNGQCHYPAFLMRYKNVLSSRLESHWCRRALGQLFSQIGEGDRAEEQWKQLDRNNDGELSYFELRPLLKSNLKFNAADIEDDGVYTLLAQLDKDCSGYVEKGEFLDAVSSGKQWHTSPERLGNGGADKENEAIDQCWDFLHGAMRALSLRHTSVSVLFRFFDTSNDGQLNREEFQAGLKTLLGANQASLMENFSNWEPLLWKLIDRDSSGFVSQDELHAALYVQDSVKP
jgi:Ca2+-binding EF-hand superfamily protein/diadenosine tetraphosphatase ApaH/serine/threonine PP2A family protein phosphatase